MSLILTFTRDIVFFKQDPRTPPEDTEGAEVNVNDKNLEFSSVEFANFQGVPFIKHEHLKVEVEGEGIESNQGHKINIWYVNVEDVSQIQCSS